MPAKKIDTEQGKTTLWLLELIEEFLTINEMDNDGNAFGWQAIKDRTVVTRLRDGGDVSLTKMDDILAFMQSPAQIYSTRPGGGLAIKKTLKPLTIQPKELP